MTDTAGRERAEPRTEAGQALAKKLTGVGRMPFSGISFPDIEDDIIAIEAEVYDSVLRGLRSEDDSPQLRAIIASVEADRDR